MRNYFLPSWPRKYCAMHPPVSNRLLSAFLITQLRGRIERSTSARAGKRRNSEFFFSELSRNSNPRSTNKTPRCPLRLSITELPLRLPLRFRRPGSVSTLRDPMRALFWGLVSIAALPWRKHCTTPNNIHITGSYLSLKLTWAGARSSSKETR